MVLRQHQILLVCLLIAFGARPADAVPPPTEIRSLMLDMEKAMKTIKSSECVFRKRVRPKSKLLPQEKIQLKSNQAGDVYMKWIGERYTNREVLYRPKHHSGKLIYKAPIINLRLSPVGMVAMAGNRHNVKEAGLLWSTNRILIDARYVDKDPNSALGYEYLGARKVYGTPSKCFISLFSKERQPHFYTDKSEICVSDKTKLPTSIKNWEKKTGKMVLIELFSWEKCRFNHLKESDFDIDNPRYGF